MTNAYPITYNTSYQLKKVDNLISLDEKKLSFLYIGDSETISRHLASYFYTGFFVNNYELACQEFFATESEVQFDVIFIDQILNEKSLQNFCFLLKRKNLFSNTVIIYNDQKLDVAKVKFLKQNELVDDALNFNSPTINYFNKISFLRKLKARQSSVTSNSDLIDSLKKERKNRFGVSSKRSVDVVLSVIALVALAPLFLIIGIIIKLESRGPVFYTSYRAGKGFKIFKFYKFRTMETGADKKIDELMHLNQYGISAGVKFLKICNDPRVTKFGRILRKTSLDELPQLFNVLIGNMSLVGNRPLPLYEASTLTTNDAVERFMAPAGITGLWQIKKRGKENMSVEERVSLDIAYARNHSFAFDLWIIASTPGVLFQKTNV